MNTHMKVIMLASCLIAAFLLILTGIDMACHPSDFVVHNPIMGWSLKVIMLMVLVLLVGYFFWRAGQIIFRMVKKDMKGGRP